MGVREAGAERTSEVGLSGEILLSARQLLFFKCPLAGPKMCPLAAPCSLFPCGGTVHVRPCHQNPVSADSMPCGKCMTLVSVCGMVLGHLFMATTSSERKIPYVRPITLNYTAF